MPVFQDVRPPFIPTAINHSLFTLSIAPNNTVSTPSTTHTERMSSGAPMEYGEHHLEIHMRKTDLTVVYTNDPGMVEDSIDNMERLLHADDK